MMRKIEKMMTLRTHRQPRRRQSYRPHAQGTQRTPLAACVRPRAAAALCLALALTFTLVTLTGCRSLPQKQGEKAPLELSRELLGAGQLSADQLAAFFLLNNPEEEYAHILEFAGFYIEEAAAEGINSDLAFAQMCLETGFLRFGGLVTVQMHNYCGLGAMDAAHPGEVFPTERMGVRAHIQHLQAYATTEDVSLNLELIDPRYSWVHKTKLAVTVYDLAGTWATDPAYGDKIDAILQRMEN